MALYAITLLETVTRRRLVHVEATSAEEASELAATGETVLEFPATDESVNDRMNFDDPSLVAPETLAQGSYHCAIEIDVDAATPAEAAFHAWNLLTRPDSFRPVIDVTDEAGQTTRVDLESSTDH